MPHYPIKSGFVCELETPPNGRHYFVVLFGPNKDGEIIIANLDSIKTGQPYDATCTLAAGVGRLQFLKRKSYLNYRRASVMTVSELISKIDSMKSCNVFTQVDDVVLLGRMRAGLTNSPHTMNRVKSATCRF